MNSESQWRLRQPSESKHQWWLRQLAYSTGYTETANFPESKESPAPGSPSQASQGGARLRRYEKHLDAAKALLDLSRAIPLLTMMSIEDLKAAYRLFKLSQPFPPQGPVCKKSGKLKGRSHYRCRFCKKKFHSKESLIQHHPQALSSFTATP